MSFRPEKQKTVQELTEMCLYLQEANMKMAAQITQLQRILWLAVRTQGAMELNEAALPPLWKLDRTRSPDGILSLTAVVMSMPPDATIAALVTKLEGTTLDIDQTLQREIGLEEYSSAWLAHYISDRIVRLSNDGKWVPAALAKEQMKQTGDN